MVTLKILDKNENDEYVLKEQKSGKTHTLTFVFYDVKAPEVGNLVQIHEKLLDKNSKEFSQPYYFGDLDDPTGRAVERLKDEEIVCLHMNGEKVICKRLFG